MLIDWFTVGAQAVNFIVLVFLMRRFLYKPILEAIDAREKKVAAELATAAETKAEAQKERDAFQHEKEEIEQQRAALLKTATEEATVERKRLLDEARRAADAFSEKRQETLRIEAENLNGAIVRRTQQEVFAIARKVLSDLATTKLEQEMADVFIRRLGALDGQAKATLAEAIDKTSDPVLVRSAFELPPEQQKAIAGVLERTFSPRVHVRFEIAPDLVSGLELVTNGQRLGWSVADYLGSLEKGAGELLNGEQKPRTPRTKPAPEAKSA